VLRSRIRDIPDGVFESEDWVEGNGHDDILYRVACRMTVQDSQITFDFEGSSPQTDGFVNCSYGALVGSIASAVVPILGWDVPFNEGVMTAFTILAPKGSIVNPVVPAPISNGHLTTGVRATRLVTRLLNRACVASENATVRKRAQGEWGDSWTGGITSGLRADNGEFFVWFNMDGGGMGTGAQPVRDGHDAAGLLTQIGNMLPDVEMNEMIYPALYLWKRLATDSPGHGASRGGMGLDYAWVLWGADESAETLFCPTAAVPPWGFAGGLPAGGSGFEFFRDTNVKQMINTGRYPTEDNIDATSRELQEPNAQGLILNTDDVFHSWLGGGGGLGDPLLRDPRLVVQDVRDEFVTAVHAEQVYGVVLTEDPQGYNPTATSARRREIRTQRLRESGNSSELREVLNPQPDLIEDVLIPTRCDGGEWTCPACSGGLGDGEDWLDAAVRVSHGAFDRLTGMGVRLRQRTNEGEEVRMDEYLCPSCATLLHATIRVATG
jgi:N-methylhydantoinase B